MKDTTVVRIEVGRRALALEVSRPVRKREPPLLAVHGIPGWRGTWRKVARELGGDLPVISPDLPGFGESDDPAPGGHAAEHAQALLEAMDRLDVGPFHLAGYDFGGPISLLVAAHAPDRVRSLTLLATNAFTDTPVPLPLRVARVPFAGDLAFRIFFGAPGLALTWAAATGDRGAFPFREFLAYLRHRRGVSWTRRIFLASLRDLEGLYEPVERALAGIRVPAQVLWGDRDPFFAGAIGRRTADAIPGAAFHLMVGAGHFLPEERPREVARRILELARRA